MVTPPCDSLRPALPIISALYPVLQIILTIAIFDLVVTSANSLNYLRAFASYCSNSGLDSFPAGSRVKLILISEVDTTSTLNLFYSNTSNTFAINPCTFNILLDLISYNSTRFFITNEVTGKEFFREFVINVPIAFGL